MAKRKNTGIYEWVDAGLGIENGCEHGCLYCYAAEAKIRRRLVADRQAWLKPVPRRTFSIPKGERLMFPTTHDITPRNYRRCEETICRLLQAGRKVLVVSKPHFECISAFIEEHPGLSGSVEFRFTIGALSKEVLRFWEPHAPSPFGRLYCVEYAVRHGFRVSVSAEPVLDWSTVGALVRVCLDAGADHVWIGLLNQWERRLAHLTAHQRLAAPYYVLSNQQGAPTMIRQRCTNLRERFGEKVVWKDSIRKLMSET